MARIFAGVSLGLVLVVFGSAQAESSPEDVQAAATDAGVSETDLEGALGSLADAGIPTTPAEYLCAADGLLCPPAPAVVHAPIPPPAPVASVWDRIAQCESSGDWHANTGNGFAGGLQFTPQTWRSHGGVGSPAQASRAQQIAVAQRVLADQGWRAWPACSRRLGLR